MTLVAIECSKIREVALAMTDASQTRSPRFKLTRLEYLTVRWERSMTTVELYIGRLTFPGCLPQFRHR